MEQIVVVIITVLTIFFSALPPYSASLHVPLMQQPSLENQGAVNAHQLSVPPLPRRLRFTEHKEHEGRDLASHKKEKKLSAGEKEPRKQKMVVGKEGTKEEWMEGDEIDEASQYFTMDYGRVRRRRPIHNKHIPVTP